MCAQDDGEMQDRRQKGAETKKKNMSIFAELTLCDSSEGNCYLLLAARPENILLKAVGTR